STDLLNIAYIIEFTKTEGPGERFGIWLQGCPIRCKGCWNPHLWAIKPNHIVKIDKLVKYILNYKDVIEGITISGGEPLYQSKSLINFIKKIKATPHFSLFDGSLA
ncbi:MAG TPA: 4Fe-4S cluster-binding domain-containing protein, partial [Candidatus Aerophobetes bacterium]|nr:4Fe-4S cluster-binding domain-containing protein [Candidatus Aerophobetes bacterium]